MRETGVSTNPLLEIIKQEVLKNSILKLWVEELSREAYEDFPTRLSNKRALYEDGVRLIDESRIKNLSLHAIRVDGDKFKGINDKYGHEFGDKVIAHIAQVLLKSIRSGDDRRSEERQDKGRRSKDTKIQDILVAREGGDEFVLLLGGCGREGAEACAERIQDTLRQIPVVTEEGEELYISASMGITPLTEDDTLETLLKRADKALYTAKASEGCSYSYLDPAQSS